MKHSKLHGVAHNFAASLAGGLSFVVPHHVIETNVYAEAAANENGFLVVDFLTGQVEGAMSNGQIERAIPLFQKAFPEFCVKNGVHVSDYSAFWVRYVSGREISGYIVTIQDCGGRRSSREYRGSAGKRTEIRDELGRRRPRHLPVPLD